jgi:hypothetical protein
MDTGILPKFVGFNMEKHDDWHKLWAHVLAIYGSSSMPFANLEI